MLPFIRQIQIAADLAKGAAARLADMEVPKHDDTEKTYAHLKARISLIRWHSWNPSNLTTLTVRVGHPNPWRTHDEFQRPAYLVHFVPPNFYFHCTTAYDILRHCGVELGKRDFI
jgi:hypothetical protein